MKTKLFLIACILSFAFSACSHKKEITILSAPAGNLFAKINIAGKTVIPNGRFLTPLGKNITVAPHPYGLTLSRDGNIAVTANSGTAPLSVSIIKNITSDSPKVMQIPPGANTDKGVLESVFMGLALSPDNKILYVSGGQKNAVYLFSVSSGKKLGIIDCYDKVNGEEYSTGYIGDLTINKKGDRIYAVDQINFRIIIINTKSKKIISNIPVGRYPFGIALSKDESKLYVANVGMYEYKRIERLDKKEDLGEGIEFPAFSYLSKESEEGIVIDSFKVPGLGKPNAPESFSVWSIDIRNEEKPTVTAKIKTGILVGEKVEGIPAVGGASPNSIAVTSKYAFVSNGNNDNISVVDIKSDSIAAEIPLKPDEAVKHFRGVIPFGLAVSPDESRLYVAESGINAVGVIDINTLKVLGHIPVGWFPSKMKVTPDGKKLIVANAKGFGSGPNGGANFNRGPEGSYIGALMKGTVSVIDIPKDEELKSLTNRVISNNFRIQSINNEIIEKRKDNPVPLYGGEKKSPIKHIVFISKENRTFDEVFGQIKNGEGDSTLARYGRNVSFSNKGKNRTDRKCHCNGKPLEISRPICIGG